LATIDGSLASSLAEILTVAVQELIEAELTARIGAERGRTHPDAERASQRAPPEATTGPFCWPPPGSDLAATGHDLMAASRRSQK
jgi:hypothetical protein